MDNSSRITGGHDPFVITNANSAGSTKANVVPPLSSPKNISGPLGGLPRRGRESDRASRPTTYFLDNKPPIVELTKHEFDHRLPEFAGDEIKAIRDHPELYSARISGKAARTIEVAEEVGSSDNEDNTTRYFGYQLGGRHVGLMRTGRLPEPQTEDEARVTFVELRVTHPLVDNAGDVLLEHALRTGGENPILANVSATREAAARAGEMGFRRPIDGEVGGANEEMALYPERFPQQWGKNSDGEWQRISKPSKYLHKLVEERDDPQPPGDSNANI